MLYGLILRLVYYVRQIFAWIRSVVLQAVRIAHSQSVGCLGITLAGAIAVSTFVVKVLPVVTNWMFPPPPTPEAILRASVPLFGMPPQEFLSPRISDTDRRRLLSLFYEIEAIRWKSNLDARARISTGQWLLDLLPRLDKPDMPEPDFRPLDKRGLVSNARPEPVLKYGPHNHLPAEDYEDPQIGVDLAEIRYIWRKYRTPEIRGTGPELRPATPRETLDESALQAQRFAAINRGDTAEYNRLVEEHRKLYQRYGVDPCTSGFFPQGCSR